jgi:hypothetical protein
MPELHRIADNRYAAVRLRFPFDRRKSTLNGLWRLVVCLAACRHIADCWPEFIA